MLIDSSRNEPMRSHTNKVQLVLKVHWLYATIRLSLHFRFVPQHFPWPVKTHEHDDYDISFRGGLAY